MIQNLPTRTSPYIHATGVMAEKVTAHPWHETALGAIGTWEPALLIAVNLVLTSRFPCCLVWGNSMTMIYNDAFAPILGNKPFSLGRGFNETWAEAWEEIGPIADRAMCGEATFIEDFPLEINRYGLMEEAFFTFCYSPVYNADGSVAGFLDTVMESTRKVLAERRLTDFTAALGREVAARTADRDTMWRLSADLMLIQDTKGAVKASNPAFTALLGWTEEEILNQLLENLVHPEDRPEFSLLSRQFHTGNTRLTVESRVLARSGQYVAVGWNCDHDGKVMLMVGRDLTAAREAAAALHRGEMALRQAQKMDAIGKLTGGVAHDFNNLLQVISGNLQLLGLEVIDSEKGQRRLENARTAVERGAKLASSLLAFGRRQALEPRIAKLGTLVSAMDDMLRRTLGEEFDIETVVAAGQWNAFIDTAQVENAVLNLCINARDAMAGDGRLTIEVSNAVLDESYADAHPEVTPGDYVVLAISDTGTGMSPEVLEQAFEPFFSTKPEGKGTGLGLSMVFGMVKQSGGHVKIYSEVGHGTTVKLYFPRAIGKEETARPQKPEPATGGNETILVAEDDEAVRTTVIEMLVSLGYTVLKASDAASALSILESGIHVDLLFTDVVMPGTLRSPELARKAEVLLPGIAVLFTSGYTENGIVHGGKLDPGVALLSKPYTHDALARKIRQVLGRQKPVPTLAAGTTTKSATRDTALSVLLVEDDRLIRENTAELLESMGCAVVQAGTAEEAMCLMTVNIRVLMTDITLPGQNGNDLADAISRTHPGTVIIFASGQGQSQPGEGRFNLPKPYTFEALENLFGKIGRLLQGT